MRRLFAIVSTLLLLLPPGVAVAGTGVQLDIDGPIGPATSEYVTEGIHKAQAEGAALVLLRLDTPGGLGHSMRDIVQAILAARIPVIGFVAPGGARAASAGTYILYATNIAAMAPATNVGAATPVNMGGGAPSSGEQGKSGSKSKADNPNHPADSATAERRKVVNDAVAYMRSLAERRGRNADWAEHAVRDGASLSAQAALKKHVIDLIADNQAALLTAIDGRSVTTAAGKTTLHTQGLTLQRRAPNWRMRLLAIVTNPTVAYILMMIGIYGLILEGFHPGAVLPGVVGAISLLVALFAFQILPVNFAGLALLLLGLALMVAEAFVPSFGALGLGGIASFVVGSILLMDTGVPGYQVPLGIIAALATAAALLLLLLVTLFMRARRTRVMTGHQGLIGAHAEVLADFDRRGRIRVRGESWQAVTRTPLQQGQRVQIVAVDGLTVTVVPEAEP